jgi:hypothetical protein
MRNGKKSHAEITPETADLDENEEEDETLKAHVAKLIRRGRVKPGKSGPPLEELLRPGPSAPSALKALRWARKG